MAAISWTGKGPKTQNKLWSVAANWSTGTVPGAADDVTIAAAGILMNSFADTIDSLTMASGSSLTLNGSQLAITDTSLASSIAGRVILDDGSTLTLSGSVSDTNAISLNASSGTVELVIAGGLGLTGKGKIAMSDDADNEIVSNGAAETFDNASTISGAGTLGDADMTLVNTGKIDATGANQLFVATGSNVITNQGTIEATGGGGGLVLEGTIANAGGTIEASGLSSTLDISDADIQGGKLLASNADIVVNSANTAVLDGTASPMSISGSTGSVLINDGDNLKLLGSFTLAGTAIDLDSQGDLTELGIAGTVSLSGGAIDMTDNGSFGNLVGGVGPSAVLNLNSHIVGSGQVGNDLLTINLGSKGLIWNDDGGTPLVVDPSYLSSAGIIEASVSSDVIIESIVDNTASAAGGKLMSITGSTIDLDNAYIKGGTLVTDSSGAVIDTFVDPNTSVASPFSVLDGTGTNAPVQIDGTLIVNDDTTLAIAGTININPVGVNKNTGTTAEAGTLTLNSNGDVTMLLVEGSATLGGGGDIILADNGTGSDTLAGSPIPNLIEGALLGTSLTNNDIIAGAGEIERLSLTNNGTIEANQADPLAINTEQNTINNAGTLEAVSGSALNIASNISNTGRLFANGGAITVDAAVSGGAVQLASTGTVELGFGSGIAATFEANATGTLILDNSKSFTGTVAGLATNGSNAIDLRDIAFIQGTTTTAFNGSSGVLSVGDGTSATTANITLLGQAMSATFTASSDGHGGTLVTEAPGIVAGTDLAALPSHV